MNISQKTFLIIFERFLKNYVQTHLKPRAFKGSKKLLESISYTLLGGGTGGGTGGGRGRGKRFRPCLVFHTACLLSLPAGKVLPWAAAVEMIHTASLIQDDLPLMDNARVRRNKASNHRLFGEDIALLAGNCLWIEAFQIIKNSRHSQKWLEILSRASGFHGLMGGQALDLRPEPSPSYYQALYRMKTASLIKAAAEGVLILSKKPQPALKSLAAALGEAFQLADDLEDWAEDRHSPVQALGKKAAGQKLKTLSQKMLNLLSPYKNSHGWQKLILWNAGRAGIKILPPPLA